MHSMYNAAIGSNFGRLSD